MDEDQKYIGHMANVTFQNIGRTESIQLNKSGGGSTNELARKYFSELDIDSTKKLYELYKVDFEMFNYSPEEYFELSRNHSH